MINGKDFIEVNGSDPVLSEPEEDPEEQLEDNLESDPQEDPEEDLEEESCEEPEEESVTQSLSCHNIDEAHQLIDDPCEYFDPDPSEEEYLSDPSSEEDTNEAADQNISNVENRSVGVTDIHFESRVSEAVVNDENAAKERERLRKKKSWRKLKERSKKKRKVARDLKQLHKPCLSDNKESHVSNLEKLPIPQNEGINHQKQSQLELEQGRKVNAFPRQQSTLKKISCEKCGSFFHPTLCCLLSPSPQIANHFPISVPIPIPIPMPIPIPNSMNTKANSCNKCGSLFHPTSCCLLTAPSQVNNPFHQSSRFSTVPFPNTTNRPDWESSDSNLYVGYLPQVVDDDRLRKLFSHFGTITEATVIRCRNTGLSKGFGFVKFANHFEANLAVTHMNGYQLDGKMLNVRVASPPQLLYPIQAVVSQPQMSLQNIVGIGPPHIPKYGVTSTTTSSFVDSLAKFPGDPEHPGSEFKHYFATTTPGSSSPFFFG